MAEGRRADGTLAAAAPLYSSEEIDSVRALMRLGIGRDQAMLRLVEHQWDLQEAASLWAAESQRTAGSPQLPAGVAVDGVDEPEPESYVLQEGSGAGFVILGAPLRHRAYIGYHAVTWLELERRLGLARGTLVGEMRPCSRRGGIYVRRVASEQEATQVWALYGRGGALPRHLGGL